MNHTIVANVVDDVDEPVVTIKFEDSEMPIHHLIPVVVHNMCWVGGGVEVTTRFDLILFKQKCRGTFNQRLEQFAKHQIISFITK